MKSETIDRKKVGNEEFLKLRGATERISNDLVRRLSNHLEILRPLFIPRKLLGSYVKSAVVEEVPRSDRNFSELQEMYRAVSEKLGGMPKTLQPPLAPISHPLEASPFQYPLSLKEGEDKTVTITSPTQWVLSYRSECPLDRLKAMVSGKEPRQVDEMKQAFINHLTLSIFLKRFPDLKRLFEDLRYHVETRELADVAGLPVVLLRAPIETFLPPDDFILQVTQLSGIAAFQEIVNLEALERIPDAFKEGLIHLTT